MFVFELKQIIESKLVLRQTIYTIYIKIIQLFKNLLTFSSDIVDFDQFYKLYSTTFLSTPTRSTELNGLNGLN